MKNFENDFNDWLEKEHYYTINRFIDHEEGIDTYIASLKELPLSMQWGVYVDFFMGKDIYLYAIPLSENDVRIHIEDNKQSYSYMFDDFNLLDEARKAALEKAIEIYNSLDQ